MYAKIVIPARTRNIVRIRDESFFGVLSRPVRETVTTER
jgi:hypothetical protein